MTILFIYLWLGICSGAGFYVENGKHGAGAAIMFGLLWPALAPTFLFARLYGD